MLVKLPALTVNSVRGWLIVIKINRDKKEKTPSLQLKPLAQFAILNSRKKLNVYENKIISITIDTFCRWLWH